MGSELAYQRQWSALLPPFRIVAPRRSLTARTARLARRLSLREAETGDRTSARIRPLAETRDGHTTYSPTVANHPHRAEIEAHEAVHRAQFAIGGKAPIGTREQLEAEADRGARLLSQGHRFAPERAAAPGMTLATTGRAFSLRPQPLLSDFVAQGAGPKYVPKKGEEPEHWSKFEPSGNQKHYLSSSGRPVRSTDKAHRIPAGSGGPKGGTGPGSPGPVSR